MVGCCAVRVVVLFCSVLFFGVLSQVAYPNSSNDLAYDPGINDDVDVESMEYGVESMEDAVESVEDGGEMSSVGYGSDTFGDD